MHPVVSNNTQPLASPPTIGNEDPSPREIVPVIGVFNGYFYNLIFSDCHIFIPNDNWSTCKYFYVNLYDQAISPCQVFPTIAAYQFEY